ncbi:MAG TPA: hypothetical protein VGF45_18425, partial [Polyangia bacterium]
VLARTGDVEGLVNAFVAEAERLHPEGAGEVDEGAKLEAAHLLVRAAVLRGEGLADPRGAEALLRRALTRLPGYSPGRQALANTLIAAGDVGALAALYEDEAARATDPARAATLMRAAYLLHRDLSRDEVSLRRLAAHAPPVHPVGAAVERLDGVGGRLAQGNEAKEALPEALEQLLTAIRAGGASARVGELALLGARWIELLQTTGVAVASPDLIAKARQLGEAALATEPPVPGAAAFLERHLRVQGEIAAAVEILVTELRQSVDRARPEVQRALRFRLALTAAEARAWSLSVAALSPLRRDNDRAAIHWSLELARRSGDAALEAEVLDEPAVRAHLVAGGDEAAFLHALALSQAQHESGKRAGRKVSAPHTERDEGPPAGPVFAAERALNQLRDVAAETTQVARQRQRPSAEAFVAAYSHLADALAGTEVGGELRQDADLLNLAAGGSGAAHAALSPPDNAFDAATAWVSGVRTGDRSRALAGLAGLATRAEPNAGAATFAQLGIRHLLAGANANEPAAVDALGRALSAGSSLA